MDKFVTAPTPASAAGSGKKTKKVVTVMDEETGEEFTKTIWVDEAGNEVPEGGVGAAAPAPAQTLVDKSNKSSPKKKAKSPVKPKPAAKPAAKGGIAGFFKKA